MSNEREVAPVHMRKMAGMQQLAAKARAAEQARIDLRRDELTLLRTLIAAGLHNHVKLSDQASTELRALRRFEGKFDMYCPDCKKESTWQLSPPSATVRSLTHDESVAFMLAKQNPDYRPDRSDEKWLGNFSVEATCTRNGHIFTLYLRASRQPDLVIEKLGQHPSARDIELGDLKDFEAGLTVKMRREYVRAITCASHGFFVAACVHYRRIFEDILTEAKVQHMTANSMTEWREFDNARVNDKIELVRAELPKFVAEHPALYGLLSKGIHELSEEECAHEMPVLRGAMEVIFKDRVAKARERKNADEASRLLQGALSRRNK